MLIIKPELRKFFSIAAEELIEIGEEFPALLLGLPRDLLPSQPIHSWVKQMPLYVWDGSVKFRTSSVSYFFQLEDSSWTVVYPDMEQEWILADWINPEICFKKKKDATWWWVELHSPQFAQAALVTQPYPHKHRAMTPPPVMASIRLAMKMNPELALDAYLTISGDSLPTATALNSAITSNLKVIYT